MIQSYFRQTSLRGLHVAIVMDGNGRWARARGLPRLAGHRRGVRAARRVVEAAPGLGIGTMTLFAFSSDNWKRPRAEVDGLMALSRIIPPKRGRRAGRAWCPPIAHRTPRPASLHPLGRGHLCRGADGGGARPPSAFGRGLLGARHDPARGVAGTARATSPRGLRPAPGQAYGGAGAPDVDLLIRTGGEQRLSDFLLWESAYAELCFVPRMWPDFGPADLAAALRDFHARDRRFGSLPLATSSSSTRRS
jgi:undecaprenyl diphosphate synthase